MKSWSLASRIVSGTLAATFSTLVPLGLAIAVFARHEVTERLDNSLQEVAERLEFILPNVESGTPPREDGHVARMTGHNRHSLAYQIATPDGSVELRSQNAPPGPFVPRIAPGFHDTPSFRVYVMPSASGRHMILVGEPRIHRHATVRHAIMIATLPILFTLPVLWLVVHWSVRRAMRPLTVLQREIRERGGANLTPIPPLDLPEELATIHAAVNALLGRLEMALSTERAFAANAAHELRNPIAALFAQTQLLERELEAGPLAERAATIHRQAGKIGRMVEKLLQLSRASSGVALSGTRFDLVPVLRFLTQELEREKGARFILTGADLLTIRGDVDAAGILLRNLLENAVLHGTRAVPVLVTVSEDRSVTIVNDCAPVDPGILARIDRPFVRGRTEAEGSGLGLAIARQIAGQFDATLDIASPAPGSARGFAVQVRFPEDPG